MTDATPVSGSTNPLLRYVDNLANEDRWSDARAIADRAGWPRCGMANVLGAIGGRTLRDAKSKVEEVLRDAR